MFDLSQVMDIASQQSSNSADYEYQGPKYRYVYPGQGTLSVKLLFNPASGLVGRIVKKHNVGTNKAICLDTYNKDCPVCQTVRNINNLLGKDIWQLKAKVRAISFAQYVGSKNYTWSKDNPEPEKGELIVLMYPQSVYKDINRLIANAGTNADQLIARNSGRVINITRFSENGQTKYKCEIDAFAPEFQSCENDAKFEEFLNSLPSLMEINCPSSVNDNIIAQAQEMADALNREYSVTSGGKAPSQVSSFTNTNSVQNTRNAYAPQAPVPQQPAYQQPYQPAPQQAPVYAPPAQNYASQAPSYQQAPVYAPPAMQAPAPVQSVNDMPCMGHHQANNPKCLACLKEVQCEMLSGQDVPF